MNVSWPARHGNIIVGLFFVALLALAIAIYQDYGLTWDEIISRTNGLVTAKYLVSIFYPEYLLTHGTFNATPDLHVYKDKDYGVFFELPVFLLERILRLTDARDAYFMRHLATFVVFWVGLVFFYAMAKHRFKNWKIALLATVFLVASPRIFAEAFYNSKDLVFMSLFSIGLYTQVQFLEKPDTKRAFWHACASAATIDVRIMGIIIPAFTLAFLAWDWLQAQPQSRAGYRFLRSVLLYSLPLVLLVILWWPFLWSNPWGNLKVVFANMAQFRWSATVLYMGNFIPATNLPWHYAPVWIFITTPLLYSMLFLLGAVVIIRNIFKHKLKLYATSAQQQDVLFLASFLGPILAVIVLHSVLYDAWRQLFFVYPGLILVATRGFTAVYGFLKTKMYKTYSGRWVPVLLGGIIIFSLGKTILFMVKEHPYQNNYFSFLTPETIETDFERDYWGSSYREALEFTLQYDKNPVVYVSSVNSSAWLSMILLRPEERKRLQWVEVPFTDYTRKSAKYRPVYFLTGYRWHPGPYPYRQEIFARRVNGVKIMSVFKVR